MNVSTVKVLVQNLEDAVLSVFVGDRAVVRLAILGLIGRLHVLIEDIPGVGKTTLALALARATGLQLARIQCTPDLLPADVLGLSVWDGNRREFVYKPGPIHAQFVLADELNRTSPRTQAAFLEAMQEERVSIDGKTIPLPQPFFMIATQNPQYFVGTFPLPEAELDRFGLSFSIGYPSSTQESSILSRGNPLKAAESLEPVTDSSTIQTLREMVEQVYVSEPIRQYIVEILRTTRTAQEFKLGASPRAGVFLQQAARAAALLEGRDYVIPEHVEYSATAVLSHRVVLASQVRFAGKQASDYIGSLVASVQKPTGL
jgi:MoxR-like ATPase